ncbi:MAG: Fe-S cluster assembly protein IscX [Phycisphaeraceae bacterium]|mgnify:CR=1 FL=1|nr:Fe-S cluster assembly protein IscX [Phycisphaerae bacterium]MBX3392656.1 Fe-S cluster assembly protein IscX [Phycisphaeraceae bacterium]HRJ50439.1 Fe-S cluster assembly protein IscX [Phycisphaerales bacterium]
MDRSYGWLDVDEIGEKLAASYPDRDPFTVRFTELRTMVEGLDGFREEPGHPVNEKILETIQVRWHEAREDLAAEED